MRSLTGLLVFNIYMTIVIRKELTMPLNHLEIFGRFSDVYPDDCWDQVFGGEYIYSGNKEADRRNLAGGYEAQVKGLCEEMSGEVGGPSVEPACLHSGNIEADQKNSELGQLLGFNDFNKMVEDLKKLGVISPP